MMIDPELIKRCQTGDEEAFNTLYGSVYKKAIWTARLVCGNMDRTEDIVQETFYECFRDIGKLKKAELFQAWFNRILVRKCRKQMRKRPPVDSLDDDNAPEIKDETNILDIVETNQANLQVRSAINRLTMPLQMTIILYYFNELSISEIAQVMKCFQGTVKSRLHYAKKKLGRELEEDFSMGNHPMYVRKAGEETVYD